MPESEGRVREEMRAADRCSDTHTGIARRPPA